MIPHDKYHWAPDMAEPFIRGLELNLDKTKTWQKQNKAKTRHSKDKTFIRCLKFKLAPQLLQGCVLVLDGGDARLNRQDKTNQHKARHDKKTRQDRTIQHNTRKDNTRQHKQ